MYPRKGLEEALPKIAVGLARRGESVDVADIQARCARRRSLQAKVDDLRRDAKGAAARVKDAAPDDREALVAAARALGEECKAAEAEERAESSALEEMVAAWPNVPLEEVPDGAQGRVVKTWGVAPTAGGLPHDEIARRLGLVDPAAAAKMSGAGWPLLVGQGAALARHLGQWMLEEHLGAGFIEVSPPLVVGDEAMFASGQLPKFADQAYRLERDGLWLVPTSEVPLVNLLAAREWGADDLPRRLVALTPNFRREAGSHGAAVRGMLRQHQFEKVEMVVATTPG
ncbi:serine--tRNA ligase, partial [bacterium]|nr:serine--tRNA ligase [bacterium]